MNDYDACPTCGDDGCREVRDGVYECVSCATPLRETWLNLDEWRVES